MSGDPKVGAVTGYCGDSLMGEILIELKQLNKTLTKLTEEHIIHFNEWRIKNEKT